MRRNILALFAALSAGDFFAQDFMCAVDPVAKSSA
jgi:hypothetical protein